MALARLSIDLEARLANLQQGLDKAGLLAERQAERMAAAFKGAQTAIVGVVGAVSAQQIVQAFNRVVDGLDALNDAADATGASIENLSALEDIAARNGTAFETVTDSVVKLNKALGEKDAAAIFKGIGLSVSELKKLDPAEAFRQVAVALAGYADDGQKARYVQELFGKSLKEVAPLLKDVAEAGKLVATVTAEQTKEAERLKKLWEGTKKDVLDLARAMSGPLIESLSDTITKVKEAKGILATLRAVDGLFSPEDVIMRGLGLKPLGLQTLDDMNGRLRELNSLLDTNRRLGLAIGQAPALEAERTQLRARIAFAKATASAGDPANYGNEGRRNAGGAPSLPDVPDGSNKASEERAKALKEQWKQVFGFIDDQQEQEIDDAKIRNDRLMEIDKERTDAMALQWKQVFETIDAEQEQAIADGKAYLDALAKDGQNAGEQIALALSSAASQAINNWQGLGDLVRGVLKDMAQLALSETILKPAQKVIIDNLSGFSWGNLFGALPSFDVGTPYVPRDMVAKIHKGERIVPAAQNRGGGAGGSGSLIYSPVINVDSRTDQAQVVQLVGQMLAADKQALFEYMRAQGAM